MAQHASVGPTHHVDLSDAVRFVQEYKTNLSHGSMVAPWTTPPPMGATVPIVVDLPAGFPPTTLQATVVLPTAGLVVLQMALSDTDADLLRACALVCGWSAEPKPAPEPPPKPAPRAWTEWPDLTGISHVGAPEDATPVEGELADTPLEQLLVTLGERAVTGKLTIGDEAANAEIFFERGNIIAVVSKPDKLGSRIGDLLVRSGKVRPRDRDMALLQAQKEGLPLGEVLVKRGFVAGPVLRQALEVQMLGRTSEQLRRRGGHYAFAEGAKPRRRSGLPPLPAAAAIFRCKVDTYMQRTPAEAEEAEAEIFWYYVHRAENAPTSPEQLSARGLDREEQRLWDLVITGEYTQRELYAVSDLGKRRTHAVVMALIDVGLAKLEKKMHPKFRLSRMKEELGTKIGQIGAGTLFDVLDLHWMADTRDVQEAYLKVVETFGLHDMEVEILEDIQKMSAEVLSRAAEARAALLSRSDRAEYRRTVLEPAQIINALEILQRQGSIDFYRGALRDAEYRYAHIVELDPYDSEAKRTLATIRARQALATQEEAARKEQSG